MPLTAAKPALSEDVALPTYTSAALYAARAPVPRLSRRIDSRKLKTKMCAYVLRGKRCPFADNCAFVHEPKEAPEMLTSPMSQQTLQSLTSDESLVSDDTHPRSGEDEEDVITVLSGKGMQSISAMLPPPPAYDEVLASGLVVEGMVPPSYPTQYRFDPYSYDGVMFVN